MNTLESFAEVKSLAQSVADNVNVWMMENF
jgi:hypothetical protein